MEIRTLELEGFRNYTAASLEFDSRCNVIYGQNAQGKTNLLEALAYLSCGRSPRTRSDKEMIGFDAASARMRAGVLARDREFTVEVELFRDRRRKMSVNKVAAKNAAALSDVYQTVFFRPEDLFLIREGAAARRRFLDNALCQLRPRYAEALAAYNRAYEQKTRILRDGEERPDLLSTLPVFNEQMIRAGAVIIHYRHYFINRLAEYAARNHAECSGGREEMTVSYATVSAVTDSGAEVSEIGRQLRAHMESHERAELASRLCLSGPHKDDLCVFLNGREARTYSSQGQTRTAALALKLAERELYEKVTGEYPVLLLDDVLSELDAKRQEFVLNRISGGQVFITCCEDDRLRELLGGKVIEIENGAVRS